MKAVIEYASPQTRGPYSWSWMLVSATDPLFGDCHNGETASDRIRVSRVGWMRYNHPDWNNGQTTYAIGAYINDSGQTVIFKGDPVGKEMWYYAETRLTAIPITVHWDYSYYDPSTHRTYLIATASSGPQRKMKCITAGGWARTFNDAIGIAAVKEIGFRNDYASEGWFAFQHEHTVRNNPYWYAATAGGWQFGGNN